MYIISIHVVFIGIICILLVFIVESLHRAKKMLANYM